MLANVLSGSVYGIDGYLVTVEVDIASGLPTLSTVGLPDAAVREARDRVVAAVRNSGYDFPVKRITVNLAPAGVRKEGAAFDLAIAVGVLAACGTVRAQRLKDWCLLGELALDGALRPVRGILPIALEARARNLKGMIVPRLNLKEALAVQGVRVLAAADLKQVTAFLDREGDAGLEVPIVEGAQAEEEPSPAYDFSDVKGQRFAKRALEVASAGGHNVILIGPPGSGKTMLSKRIPSILPPLTFEESVETTKIHSVSGQIPRHGGLVKERPFRSPHHTISDIALIGGGQFPRPGEVSLAHNGVLFLDELPEFHRNALEVLRQPLESSEVMIARAKESLLFPARFMLVAAMNPCPCGFHGHPGRECVCNPYQIRKYLARISGPLLDRIDIHLEIPALKLDELASGPESQESSADIRRRVVRARSVQEDRFAPRSAPTAHANAHMTPRQVKKFCRLDPESQSLMSRAIEKLGFSARAYDRILKVARTVADLEASDPIRSAHVAEAVQYRSLDRLPA